MSDDARRTPTPTLTDEELGQFGLRLDDDGFHPYDPDERWWNESWFWDWYDDDGTVAGHCRIGCVPTQNRVWLWLYLYDGGEWLAVEQPFLDLSLLRRPLIAFDQPGLSFSYDITDPMRAGRLRVRSQARVVSGPRAGRTVPTEVDLAVTAVGPPHSTGQGNRPGHMSEGYDASRMEQPIDAAGTIRIGDRTIDFHGRGERDHSWGPRYWLLEWSFLVLNGPERRVQCVEVRFPGDGTVEVGYLLDEAGMHDLASVDLQVERTDALDGFGAGAARGTCSIQAHDGAAFAFRYEPITTHEMDLSHVLEPAPPRSTYRRTLIRAFPEDGSPPLIGWLEDHTMPEGLAPAGDDDVEGAAP